MAVPSRIGDRRRARISPASRGSIAAAMFDSTATGLPSGGTPRAPPACSPCSGDQLGGEVDAEGERRGVRVVEERPHARDEDLVRVVPGAPRVERVRRLQPGLETSARRAFVVVARCPRAGPRRLGHVDQQGTFAAASRGWRPAPRAGAGGRRRTARPCRTSRRACRTRMHAVGVEQRLVRAVLPGQRARVGGDHVPEPRPPGPPSGRPPGCPRLGRGRQRRRGTGRPVPHRLQEHRDHPRGRLSTARTSRYSAAVVTSSRPVDTTRLNREAPPVVQQRRERRPGVGDEGDRPRARA